MIEEEIFKKSIPDNKKLLDYGFKYVDSKYKLNKLI